jgi:hypothetical protein
MGFAVWWIIWGEEIFCPREVGILCPSIGGLAEPFIILRNEKMWVGISVDRGGCPYSYTTFQYRNGIRVLKEGLKG